MTGTIAPIGEDKKAAWNHFIDFMREKGYAGSTALDDRSTKLGEGLMAQYNKQFPKSPITYADVANVQAALQQYRQDLVNRWKSGQATADIKSADEIMPGISKVDGWLGSKTSSYKFPTAVVDHNGTNIDFGTNTELYDKFMDAKKTANGRYNTRTVGGTN